LGFAAAVVIAAVSDGLTAEMIENGTNALSGQLQLHAKGYLPARHIYDTMGDSGVSIDSLVAIMDAQPGVIAAAPRIFGGGLLSTAEHTEAAMLVGLDPAREARVSKLIEGITEGRAPRAGAHEIAIGSETARRLHAALDTDLVVVAPAADGTLGNDLYAVVGIFHTGLADLDAGVAVMPLASLQTLLVLPPNRVHEIAASVRNPWDAPAIADALSRAAAVARSGVAVEAWTVFRPELESYAAIAKGSNGLLIGIVFLMAIFGVTNTLLMSTFERRREFAMEQALGVTGGAVARTVVYEGLVLGVASLLVGAVIAGPILYWWHVAPPDLSGAVGNMTISGALVRPVLRAELSWSVPIQAAFALLVTSILAALYPAFRATRIPPADALGGRA
jgi:putative ABC transport system permease protein